jgi:hypothetical protein
MLTSQEKLRYHELLSRVAILRQLHGYNNVLHRILNELIEIRISDTYPSLVLGPTQTYTFSSTPNGNIFTV